MSAARRSTAAAQAPVFAALGDQTRLSLVVSLSGGGPRSIAQLTEGASVTRQAISKHLRVLEGAGLVRSTRRGRESHFQLQPGRLEEARHYLDRISADWDKALARLRSFVERDQES